MSQIARVEKLDRLGIHPIFLEGSDMNLTISDTMRDLSITMFDLKEIKCIPNS